MSAFSVSRVVVTGGAQGIGASIAHRLASEGLAVSILDVNDVGAKETAERIAAETGGDLYGFGCDVTDREQVGEVFAYHPGAPGAAPRLVGVARRQLWQDGRGGAVPVGDDDVTMLSALCPQWLGI